MLFRLFLAREASTSTAIGRGIALPHARNPVILHVEHPMVTLCFLEQPVEFGASDGKPVEVLFSLVCPTMREPFAGPLADLIRLARCTVQRGDYAAIAARRHPAQKRGGSKGL